MNCKTVTIPTIPPIKMIAASAIRAAVLFGRRAGGAVCGSTPNTSSAPKKQRKKIKKGRNVVIFCLQNEEKKKELIPGFIHNPRTFDTGIYQRF